jgi:hypothetical protein
MMVKLPQIGVTGGLLLRACAGAQSVKRWELAGFRERSAEVVPASTVIALTGAARRGNSAGMPLTTGRRLEGCVCC